MVGIFPLPAVVPLLPEDTQGGEVRLLAGIRENGLSDRRAPYPFFTAYEQLDFPDPGMRDTLTRNRARGGRPAAAGGGLRDLQCVRFHDWWNRPSAGRCGGPVFEGDESGRIEVSVGAEAVRVRTVEQEYGLQNGAPAFLEMDYRCDQPFAVGLFGFRSGQEWQHPAMVLTATDDGLDPVWNKIYIDLAPLVTAQGTADHFEVYFECFLESGRSTGTVGLDNLRILTY